MIPSGPHKFKNALSDPIIFPDKEFDLVLDVGKSVLSHRLLKKDKDC
jgi:hypothetical protein